MKKLIIVLLLLFCGNLYAQDTIRQDSICSAISIDSATIYGLERQMYYANCTDTINTLRWDYIYYRDSAGVRTFALPCCASDSRVVNSMWYIVSKKNVQLQIIRRSDIWLKKP